MAKNAAFVLLSFLLLNSPLYAAMDIAGYQGFIQWVISQQAGFHRELVTLVRSISKSGSPILLWGLITTSFLYGVFHAAGPGHGKAVISAYMLASKAPLRRGIGLAFLCAGVQALMAVLVIVTLSQVFSLAGKAMQISRFFEVASFAAVGMIGVWMLVRLSRGKSSCGHDHSQDGHNHNHNHNHNHDHDHSHSHSHDHSHSHSHDHSHDSHLQAFVPHDNVENHSHENTHQGKSHEHGAACTHCAEEQIAVMSEDIFAEKKAARRGIWAMVFAVGIRPCTGAILVLLFSLSAGIFQWGLVATFAMAFGTAITVAALAGVSVFIRDTGLLLSNGQSKWHNRLSRGFGFFAALVLIFISVSMIWSYISNAGRAF